MKNANVIRGRIEEHGQGLGTVDESLVRQRAREIAITNGRTPNEANESDLAQARAELQALQNDPGDSAEPDLSVLRDGPPVSSGRSAPTRLPTDEQTLVENLVAEGLEEAEHDQMVAGNQQSRENDERMDDQLPS